MSYTSTQQTKCSIKTFLQTSKIREVFVLINGDYVKYVKLYIFLKVIGILELKSQVMANLFRYYIQNGKSKT